MGCAPRAGPGGAPRWTHCSGSSTSAKTSRRWRGWPPWSGGTPRLAGHSRGLITSSWRSSSPCHPTPLRKDPPPRVLLGGEGSDQQRPIKGIRIEPRHLHGLPHHLVVPCVASHCGGRRWRRARGSLPKRSEGRHVPSRREGTPPAIGLGRAGDLRWGKKVASADRGDGEAAVHAGDLEG